jgi:putative oxidoreductase
MSTKLFSTTDNAGLTLIRVVLGAVILPHGLQKTFGLFGGYGWEGTMGFFTGQMGIPAALAALAIIAESLGAVALMVGFLGRVAALGIIGVMVGAVMTVHANVGFFMNWNGTQAGEGFEYHLLAVAMGALIVWKGSGAYSVDRVIAARA